MRITLATHGGLAPALRLPPVVIETTALPAAARDELRRLLSAAEASAARRPGAERGRRMPDSQSYVVQIEEDDRTRSLSGSDLASDPDFDALCDWIRSHAPDPCSGVDVP